MSETKRTETAIEGLRKFMAWADSFPVDATYEQPGFVCVDLITVDVDVRTLFNLRAEIDAKDAEVALLTRELAEERHSGWLATLKRLHGAIWRDGGAALGDKSWKEMYDVRDMLNKLEEPLTPQEQDRDAK